MYLLLSIKVFWFLHFSQRTLLVSKNHFHENRWSIRIYDNLTNVHCTFLYFHRKDATAFSALNLLVLCFLLLGDSPAVSRFLFSGLFQDARLLPLSWEASACLKSVSFRFFYLLCFYLSIIRDLSSLYFFKASLKVSKSFIPTSPFSLLFPRSFCLSIIWIPSFLLSSLLVLGSFYLSIIWILSLLLSSLFVLKRFCPSQIWNLPFLLSSLLVLRRFCPSQIW